MQFLTAKRENKMRKPINLYIDQYGNKFYARTLKELKEQVSGSVKKMYVDSQTLGTPDVGYVIGQHWLTAYTPVEKRV